MIKSLKKKKVRRNKKKNSSKRGRNKQVGGNIIINDATGYNFIEFPNFERYLIKIRSGDLFSYINQFNESSKKNDHLISSLIHNEGVITIDTEHYHIFEDIDDNLWLKKGVSDLNQPQRFLSQNINMDTLISSGFFED